MVALITRPVEVSGHVRVSAVSIKQHAAVVFYAEGEGSFISCHILVDKPLILHQAVL